MQTPAVGTSSGHLLNPQILGRIQSLEPGLHGFVTQAAEQINSASDSGSWTVRVSQTRSGIEIDLGHTQLSSPARSRDEPSVVIEINTILEMVRASAAVLKAKATSFIPFAATSDAAPATQDHPQVGAWEIGFIERCITGHSIPSEAPPDSPDIYRNDPRRWLSFRDALTSGRINIPQVAPQGSPPKYHSPGALKRLERELKRLVGLTNPARRTNLLDRYDSKSLPVSDHADTVGRASSRAEETIDSRSLAVLPSHIAQVASAPLCGTTTLPLSVSAPSALDRPSSSLPSVSSPPGSLERAVSEPIKQTSAFPRAISSDTAATTLEMTGERVRSDISSPPAGEPKPALPISHPTALTAIESVRDSASQESAERPTPKPDPIFAVNRRAWVLASIFSSCTLAGAFAVNVLLIVNPTFPWIAPLVVHPIMLVMGTILVGLVAVGTLWLARIKLKDPPPA